KDIDAVADQLEELDAVALDTEAIGERESDFAARALGHVGRVPESSLGVRPVEEIAFEIDDARSLDELLVDVARAQLRADAKEGVHRALAVRRDEDERAGCRRATC